MLTTTNQFRTSDMNKMSAIQKKYLKLRVQRAVDYLISRYSQNSNKIAWDLSLKYDKLWND